MITAIIPVFNTQPHELRTAVDSIRATKIVTEIVLIDDHSDSMATQCELQRQSELGARALMSRCWRNTQGARATGIHAARGDYILNCDADDTLKNSGVRLDDLAPINFASQNTPNLLPSTVWSYLDLPIPMQWGAIVRTDLARQITTSDDAVREEDIKWGYRLWVTQWRDKIHIKLNSGIHYHWRSNKGRDTATSRFYGKYNFSAQRRMQLLSAINQQDLCTQDADYLTWWYDRKTLAAPRVHTFPAPAHARVDTHVLSYLGNLEWLEQCLQSLQSEPTQTHLVMGGFPNSIGAARAFAFTLGSAEYVCFMDDDDYIVAGAMQQCIDYLDAHPECVGVYTDTEHLHPNGRHDIERKGRPWTPMKQLMTASEITHLKVMRRSAVMPYLNEMARWATWEEYVLCGLMVERGYWQHLPLVGAVKRSKPASESSMRLSSSTLWKHAVAKVTPYLMRALKNPPKRVGG